jgi:hypothetical protein
MFNKLFKPRWQHRKVAVRIAAVNELAPDDPVLREVAANDGEPSVRRHALRRITDLSALAKLYREDPDESVREGAGKRLKRLLAAEEEGAPEASLRQGMMLELGEEELLAYVLQHAPEAELRHAALAQITRPALLAQTALGDRSGELRLAALERIDRVPTLERLAREAKGKDKRVARRARERLEALRAESERPERQRAICEGVEALVAQGAVDLVACDRLKREWHDLLPAASEALAQRYAAACDAFAGAQAQLQAEAALTARQRELCERSEQLQQEVEGSEADLIGMDSAITLLQRAWQGLEEEGAALSPSLAERFHGALAATERRRSERLRQRQEQARLQAIIDELEALPETAPAPKRLEQIEQAWRAADGEQALRHTAALRSHYAQALQRAQQHLARQGEECRALQQEVTTLLGELEGALEEGQLKLAASCHDKARERINRLQSLGGRVGDAQQKRLHQAAARLRELRDWRRFGTDRAREQLLEELDALQKKPLAPLKQAEAVKGVRERWRQLDRKGGPAAEELWQAFDEAAEAAYTPCRAYFEEQQQQRAAHLEARRRFLDEIEQFLHGAEAEDAHALEQRLQQAKKRWPKLGGVEHREWRAVNDRFRRLIEAGEQRLEPRREQEKVRREGLIAKVERLADEPDLEKALSDTKAAQAAWRPEVSAHRHVEQALWRRFKAACDAIYARQRQQSQARRAAEQEAHARLERLCGEIEGLVAGLDESSLPRARGRLAELQAEWEASRGSKGLGKRYAAACAAFRQAEEGIRQRQADAERQHLLEKIGLCEGLEAQLFNSTAAGQDENRWQALPPLQHAALEQALTARYRRALAALEQGGATLEGERAAAVENLAQRQALCLELELLADIDSPAAFAEERMALQVEMLAGAMTGQLSAAERQTLLQQRLAEYLALGPVPEEEQGALLQRLQAVLNSAALL